MDIVGKFAHEDYIKREQELSATYYYLDRYINGEIFVTSDIKGNFSVKKNHTIWVLWLQGMECAPKLGKKCYESVCRNKPNDFEVILLTQKNLNQYVDLPEYIWEKHSTGCITTTHLSDIIRVELLCTYGGCWIDATVYCSGAIPRHMVSGRMFLFKGSMMDEPVLKMSSWWLAGDRNNRILHAARKTLYRYWEQETDARNYFLFHIIMSKIIDEDSASGVIFREIPYFNNGNAHVLQGKLEMAYDEDEWEVIKDISKIHKLSYKRRYVQGDIYSYYIALLEGKLD